MYKKKSTNNLDTKNFLVKPTDLVFSIWRIRLSIKIITHGKWLSRHLYTLYAKSALESQIFNLSFNYGIFYV